MLQKSTVWILLDHAKVQRQSHMHLANTWHQDVKTQAPRHIWCPGIEPCKQWEPSLRRYPNLVRPLFELAPAVPCGMSRRKLYSTPASINTRVYHGQSSTCQEGESNTWGVPQKEPVCSTIFTTTAALRWHVSRHWDFPTALVEHTYLQNAGQKACLRSCASSQVPTQQLPGARSHRAAVSMKIINTI